MTTGRTHRMLALAASALALAAALPAAAGARADERAGAAARPVLLGVLGGRERFDGLTGQRTRVGHVIAAWGQGPVMRILDALGKAPMLGISTGGGLTPRDIAQGRGDAWLAELNAAVAARSGRVYIRPLAEMNGHWNDYCAFDRSGRPRGPSHSAAAYYPGDAYVDVVANDLCNIGGKAEWAANERLYAAYPRKPYAIGEWANWGFDDPGFVTRMAEFVRTHRRVELLAYYNGRPGSPWDLVRSRGAGPRTAGCSSRSAAEGGGRGLF